MIGSPGFPAARPIDLEAGLATAPLSRTGPARDERHPLRACIFGVDRLLRRYYGVRDFSPVADNILRISTSALGQRVILGDGTELLPGDVVIDLHLWNERIPGLGSVRSGLGWGSRAKRRVGRSLAMLAAHVEANPDLVPCRAIRAEAVFLSRRQLGTLSRIAERFGFDDTGWVAADPGHTLLAFALAWVCHPGEVTFRRLQATRYTFWMSRCTLRERHLRAGDGIAAAVAVHAAASERAE